ncbi:MAG: peptidoglycan-associated lipoprotein [Deltaproteobacteria bacterium]|nr:MAG: peptidoglycan-associated lipoprotein [Deltaproteobacteria bacterium]
MITIVVFTFVVLFSFGCSSKKEEQAAREAAEAAAKAKAQQEAIEKQKEAERLKKEKEAQIKAAELERQKKLEQQRAEEAERAKQEARAEFVNESVYFDFDSSDLNEEAREILDKKAEWMTANPDATITIEGNCDDRGTTEYNLALGEKRAESAKKYLEALGIDSSKIKVISYGEERPAVMGSGEEVWSKNRRDDFVIDSE